MVLLEQQKLLLQGLQLALGVHTTDVCVIDDLPQACDVGLHRLPDGQLVLKPAAQTSSGPQANVVCLRFCVCKDGQLT